MLVKTNIINGLYKILVTSLFDLLAKQAFGLLKCVYVFDLSALIILNDFEINICDTA